MSQNTNPLAAWFRQPTIYVRLPSQGRGWPREALDLPENGEVAVRAMTARDEITYRTPDALFNGEAVVQVIESCVPAIRDAWQCPAVDLDTVLIAIRIASYGHAMDIESRCPACSNESTFGLDLRRVIDNLRPGNYERPLQLGDLSLKFRSLTYRQQTQLNVSQFNQQRVMQNLQDESIDIEQRLRMIREATQEILEVTVSNLALSIAEIITPNGTVTDTQHIREWLGNLQRSDFDRVQQAALDLKQQSELRPESVTCSSCQHQYQQQISMDQANFFADAS